MPTLHAAVFGAVFVLYGGVAAAQPARDARVQVTIVDVTGAILPGATVTVVPHEPATATGTTAIANENGIAIVGGLKPGRYRITATFAGFDAGELSDVRLRAGDNKQELELAITGFTDTVDVGLDPQAAAADPNNALSTQLTDEEIAALPDDPDELVRQLVEMAGGNARVRIDGFNGGSLPSRDVIRSIRIVRDTFPAENHSAESDGVDIITQAGVGPIRGGFSTRVRDSIFSGSNPFVEVKAPERTQNFDVNLGGAIVPNKSSFTVFMGGRKQFDTPVATYTTQSGKRSQLLGRRPNDGWNLNGMFDYMLTREHILRVGYSRGSSSRSNLGIGGFDLAERAFSSESTNHQVRLQEAGPIGRNAYLNTRAQLRFNRNESRSQLEAPTIRVLDAFTSGGAQARGGTRQQDVELSSDLNYVRGRHTMRTGVLIDGRRYRTNAESNYLGTYIFSSREDFEAGRPRNYTRRVGDPLILYSHLEAGAYVQDDVRLRPNLTFSPGLRYEVQTHVHDYSGFAPRLGLTWAPGKAGQTTIRTSYGVFYNWLGGNVYEQTLRVNGVRLREINVVNPSYPEVGSAGTVNASNRYLLGDVKMERIHRYSAAIERTVTPKVRTSFTFSLARYSNQLRGLNLNALVDGVRPDPNFANVIQVVSDAAMETYDLVPDISVNFAGGIRNADQARWDARRTVVRFNYRHRRAYNNSDGAFSVPPTGSLDDQWAIASSDTRHRLRGSVSTQALRNLNAQVSWDANSGSPYTITTGTDDNGDSIFNDRPLLTPRNSARLPWRSTLSANVSYTIPIGQPRGVDGGRGGGRPGPAGARGGTGGGPRGGGRGGPPGRQKGITINVNVQNLTNRANYSGFSGVMTSSYFMQPTSVSNPRQVDISLRFNF
ncbi:MAG TPA: TonB-dependent receptor [Vicinamibacterales bacterium]|nr:TonB-dependent receptor [Vicinamibacterales bacterium]